MYFLEASLLVGMALALLFYERKNMNWRVIFFRIEFFFYLKKKIKQIPALCLNMNSSIPEKF